MKRKALLMGVSDKVKNNSIILLDKLEMDKIKTKEMAKIFQNFQEKVIDKKTKASMLLILGDKNENVIKSVSNINKVTVMGADSLNIVDILRYEYLLITAEGVKKMEKIYK